MRWRSDENYGQRGPVASSEGWQRAVCAEGATQTSQEFKYVQSSLILSLVYQ